MFIYKKGVSASQFKVISVQRLKEIMRGRVRSSRAQYDARNYHQHDHHHNTFINKPYTTSILLLNTLDTDSHQVRLQVIVFHIVTFMPLLTSQKPTIPIGLGVNKLQRLAYIYLHSSNFDAQIQCSKDRWRSALRVFEALAHTHRRTILEAPKVLQFVWNSRG